LCHYKGTWQLLYCVLFAVPFSSPVWSRVCDRGWQGLAGWETSLMFGVKCSVFFILCICLVQYVVGNYCKTFRPSWKVIKLLHQRGKLLEWYFQTHREMLLLWQDCFTMLPKLCIDIVLWEPSTNWDIHYKNIHLVLHHTGSVYLWTVNRGKIICDCRSVC
jgi:hypothetical protein